MLKDVIILGCGPTHVECKYNYETWGVNGTYTFAKRLDKLFMTDEVSEVDGCWYDLPLMMRLNPTMVFPVEYPRFRECGFGIEIYPIEELMAKFPTSFFSNSIAYMIAYALTKTKTIQTPDDLLPRVIDGYNKIYLYGIDMMTNSTYIQEKGGVEFWMGVALGMGVEIVNTRGSATGKTWNGKMYGHYGTWEVEQMKEKILAPWELIRVEKTSSQKSDWIRGTDGIWKSTNPVKVAGEEVETKT